MINERIHALREQIRANGLDAYIIPSSDPHKSEYVAEHWAAREWISGFTGSAGTVVVTLNESGLWTDSRYFLQAEEQLATSEMILHKIVNRAASEYLIWLSENLNDGSVIGIDGRNFSKSELNYFQKLLEVKGIKLKYDLDLIDPIWQDRPEIPDNKIFEHDLKWCGKSSQDKLDDIRKIMKERNLDYHLLTALDDIAWTFNIRGSDVEYNPVCIAFAVIGLTESFLFIDNDKIEPQLKANFESQGILIQEYQNITGFLKSISETDKILLDPFICNISLYQAIDQDQIIEGGSLPRQLKAQKNEIELENIRQCMKKDGVALLRLFRWLENEIKTRSVPEAEVAERLAKFRSDQKDYFGESFAAIVGFDSNGAIIHYKPEYETCANISDQGILLLDSGGQYLDGTTDITRTVAFGESSQDFKTKYTAVLKGHIALAMANVPKGTNGYQLDVLARQHLWQDQANFAHGTGHGVGFFLNVHEPPQSIGNAYTSGTKVKFVEGMLTSNEPGYYEEGEYGIRIENLIVSHEQDDFINFETVTLFPIDTNIIQIEMINLNEKNWLNEYHENVYNSLSPMLDEDERAWLAIKCAPI